MSPPRRLRLADLADDPYPILAALRAESPVARLEEPPMWLVTRRDDVLAVLRDPETFRVDSPRSTIRDTFGEHMLSTEGDQQRRYKRQCAPPFNARAVREGAAPRIAARVARLLDAVEHGGTADLRPALASPLAVGSVLDVLGIPDAMHEAIVRWYADFAAALANFAWDPEVRARGRASAEEFRGAMRPLVRDAGRGADGSLLGVLARATDDRLDDEEILSNALIVLFGGIETTEATLLNVIWALLHHPAALAAVRADASRLDGAIEEAIRWEPAVQSCTRHAARAVALGGAEIAPGDTVQCMLGAANRDPAHFTDPDRFDFARANASDHVSFGAGRHFCLGAAMAREEARVAVAALLERFPQLALDEASPSAPHGYEFRAPTSLRVRTR
jgi:cytochrome P450